VEEMEVWWEGEGKDVDVDGDYGWNLSFDKV
jgi:hypothetical protein